MDCVCKSVNKEHHRIYNKKISIHRFFSKEQRNTDMKRKAGVYEKYIKRIFDFTCAFIAFLVLSPILLIVAILVRIKLGSPVLFKQQRAGCGEKPFNILKFRTMTDERDENGKLLPDEVRLTKFGKALRSTSLDELPSLINIMKGDMSIIGPRALPTKYIPYYTEREHHRHDVRPGLSGLAQVNGRNYVSWEDKFEMDLQYVSNITFWGDVKIIFKTVSVIFKRENIDTGSYIEKDGVIYRPLDVERAEKCVKM